ncbi:dentin sialophosphoprotein [Diachasmimorpha longicaudata]|uniref:dentin sialophosphoprotein n=1 Tax=Diachasmimorpha longicaudata TaxID=58733 RepID=UPI0030B8F279
MTKKSLSMGSMKTTRITWSMEELTALVNDKKSQVHLIKTQRHIALHPCQLGNLKQSLQDILGDELNHYDDKLHGLLLSYKNPKLLSERAAMLYDSFSCHVDIEADFYVFRPKVGHVLKGVIIKKPANHLGVLVHKAFNVSIPRKDHEGKDWEGNHMSVGDEVTFSVQLMDLKPGRGKLPFIRGELVASDCADEIALEKSRKHSRFADEDASSEGFKSDENEDGEISKIDMKPKFSSTVNEESSSESEGESVEAPKFQKIQDTSDKADKKITDHRNGKIEDSSSSSDSDIQTPVFDKSRKKELSKKSGTTKLDIGGLGSDSTDSPKTSTTPDKSKTAVRRSSTISDRGKILFDSSDDSDDEVPFSNKYIEKETPKKIPNIDKSVEKSPSPEKISKKSVKKVPSFDDSDSDVPFLNGNSQNIQKGLNSVKSEETVNNSGKNHNTTANSDTSDDELPFSIKPIKKLSSPAQSLNTLVQQDSNGSDDDVPFGNSQNSNEMKDISNLKSEQSQINSENKCGKMTLEDNETNFPIDKSSKKKNNTENEDVDSDDDFASFMLVRKIEEEDDAQVENLPNSNSLKKKSKNVSNDAEVEHESVQMLLHAKHIKSEEEKPRRSRTVTEEDGDVDIPKKVKKEKKKKRKKSERSEEELHPDLPIKIKKEKSVDVSGSSKEITNLQVEDVSEEVEARDERSEDAPGTSPAKPAKMKKRSSKSKLPSVEDNELSDTCSIKTKLLVKREESVFFTNITIKQEPNVSDVESMPSRKRKRSDTLTSSERIDTFGDIRIKRELSVVKSEGSEKEKKRRKDIDSSIKREASDIDDAPPRKKSKKKFSE